jgi:uncharacterized protein YyaL (SSP411 family)
MLSALDFYLAEVREIAIMGDPAAPDTQALLAEVFRGFRRHQVVAVATPDNAAAIEAIPLLADRPQRDGRATAYVCVNYACQAPVTDVAALVEQLGPAG